MVISIIIPVYNQKKFLSRCLASLQNQKFRDWEAILIDDGSTDGSGSICDTYAGKDQRIHVIHQKNQGVSAARNAGIEVCHGKYLVFMDADDAMDCDLLEKASEKAAASPDVILVNVKQVKKNHKISDFGWSVSAGASDDWIRRFLLAGFAREVFRKICRKDVWADLRFPIGFSRGEDLYTVPDIVKKARSYSVIEGSYYYYNKMPHGSATETRKQKDIVYDFLAWKHGLDDLEEQNLKKEDKESIRKLYEASCTRHALAYLHHSPEGMKNDDQRMMRSWLQKMGIEAETKEEINISIEEAGVSFYTAAMESLGPLPFLWAQRAVKTAFRLFAMYSADSQSQGKAEKLAKLMNQWKQEGLHFSAVWAVKLWLMEKGLYPGMKAKGEKLMKR